MIAHDVQQDKDLSAAEKSAKAAAASKGTK